MVSNAAQPMNGPNGSYSICSACGGLYGTSPQGGIGMWMGTCNICGAENVGLSNALHDWGIYDHEARDYCSDIIATRTAKQDVADVTETYVSTQTHVEIFHLIRMMKVSVRGVTLYEVNIDEFNSMDEEQRVALTRDGFAKNYFQETD